MLEAEEVDDDFFTPVAGTSLANIFGNTTKNKENVDNDSLKYIPPKPQNITPKKKEQPKATQCVFACALIGLEWSNNAYYSRGKLGFAIIKFQKTGDHNIVLYDSNKTTLSSTPVSVKLEITIKNNCYISYYDSYQKYWSIYGTEEEVKKIANKLKTLGVNVNYSQYKDQGPLEPNNLELETHKPILEVTGQQNTIESDTDSSIHKKTKASILNRMANMGHSVLPTRTLPAVRSSDSSDTNETDSHPKTVRQKTTKTSVKRNNVENIITELLHLPENHQKVFATKADPETNVAVYKSQLMPLTNSNIIPSSSSEFGMFMSEQRINNSELRINISRIADKVDLVLGKINHLDNNDKNTNVSTDITLKLLAEYENKIKVYEELLKSRDINTDKVISDRLTTKDTEIEILKSKILEHEKQNKEKDLEIFNLQQEIKALKNKSFEDNQHQYSKEYDLLTKISTLENDLTLKNKELMESKSNTLENENVNNSNIGDKVRDIMNDTFQTITMNFDDDEVYNGATVKRTVGVVIKKITKQSLGDLK